MKIGRRIYYDLNTGNVLLNTGERRGNIKPTTINEDFQLYSVLLKYNKDSVGVIELEYGEYSQDFKECNGYRVNLDTKQLEFSYPTDGTTTEEHIFQEPLSDQVKSLESENATLLLENANQEQRINDLETENATILLELAEMKGGTS